MYLEEACREMSKAINYLIQFVAIVISTRDKGQLQKLSDLALTHITVSKKHCGKCKDEMEQNISDTLIRRQLLESNVKRKDILLSKKKSFLKSKEEEVNSWEILVRNAQAVYKEKEKTYIALKEQYEKGKIAYVGINAATAVYGVFLTLITAGAAAPLAIGLQSGVTVGSSLGLNQAFTNQDSARKDYTKCYEKLQQYRREMMELKDDCKKLEIECDHCRKEKRKVYKEHEDLLEGLGKITTLFECLCNCRHFLSILQGRTEILQEARKGIAFQHELRLPIEEIIKHLISASSLNSFNLQHVQETRQLCENLSGQLDLMPNSFIDHNVCNAYL